MKCWDGMCGASDCEICNPGGRARCSVCGAVIDCPDDDDIDELFCSIECRNEA